MKLLPSSIVDQRLARSAQATTPTLSPHSSVMVYLTVIGTSGLFATLKHPYCLFAPKFLPKSVNFTTLTIGHIARIPISLSEYRRMGIIWNGSKSLMSTGAHHLSAFYQKQ